MGCPRPTAATPEAGAETAQRGPQTELERRAWLLLEGRCLAVSGPPCSWSDELQAGAEALAGLLEREGRQALGDETVVRTTLQRVGIGHPNVIAAALFYTLRPPDDAALATYIDAIAWPFAARAFGVVEWVADGRAAPSTPAADGAPEAPRDGMLVLVAAEPLVEMEPPPRWLPQEANVEFHGRLLPGVSGLRALLSDPAGAIRSSDVAAGADGLFRGSMRLGPQPGRYIFELLAEDTALGPQVVYLLPIELSFEPPAAATTAGGQGAATTEPEAAERVMAERLAAYRAEQGLAIPTRDARLDEVARAHALDMAAHGFFGHHSPTRGDLAQRLRAAGHSFPRAAENLAVGPSAEAAFATLLESPAHRANFLEPEHTLFGVAAAASGGSLLFAVVLASPHR
ncbi:MAG: CAP domain-containing protein [Deltaproteobacteria bacterium]|nr:CAP domain-containing protein [Deltaproteobacteria bacterium]